MKEKRFSLQKAKEVMHFVFSLKKETYTYQNKTYQIRSEFITMHRNASLAFYAMLLLFLGSSIAILINECSSTPFMADNYAYVFTALLGGYLIFFYPLFCMVIFPEPIITYLKTKEK